MKVPYRDLSIKDPALKEELLQSVDRVLSHGKFMLGPEVEQFENKFAQMCHKKYAVGMNSGTDALYLALRALNIGPGDEVITTPLSWVATLNSIVLTGATPVFVDIAEDLNINTDLIEKAITPRTKAIMPVHFTGRLCAIARIKEIASKHGIALVEDASQAFGAHINGELAGSFSKIGCFSLNPMKVLCAYGEAGVAVTDEGDLYEKLLSLRYAGTKNKEDCHYPSLNGRLDTIQAAMLLVNLKYVDQTIKRHQEIAKQYTEHLHDVVTCPPEDGTSPVFYSYTILTDKRDELKEYLSSKGVETKIQHQFLMPYQTAYKGRYSCHIPVAERLVKQLLCIPNAGHLSQSEIEYVIACIRNFFGANSKPARRQHEYI
jgi:dTDP-4-amino-4,6-dideoxygalactose transaminase